MTPRLIRQNAGGAGGLRAGDGRRVDAPRTACWRSACRSSTRCTCCPNAKALRLVESGSFIALQHKWTLRTCFNAQEEIYLASMDEISQVQAIHPQLGRYLGPPCVLRNKIVVAALHRGHALLRRAGVAVVPATSSAASDVTPILPWIAHLYTATGAVIALLATGLTFAHNFRGVFIYFVVATFVDATDGWLARALRVKERLPNFDGGRLDDIIDYLTYAFIPALVVWQAELVPMPFPVCAAMVLSSAYGFAQADAKIVIDSPEVGRHPIISSPASRRTGTSSSSICSCWACPSW